MLEMLNPKLLIHEIAHTLLLYPTNFGTDKKSICGNCKLLV